MKKWLVITICIIALIALGVWDIYLYMDDIPGNSITQIIRDLTTKSALVPYVIGFAAGYLAAHFFEGVATSAKKRILKTIGSLPANLSKWFKASTDNSKG